MMKPAKNKKRKESHTSGKRKHKKKNEITQPISSVCNVVGIDDDAHNDPMMMMESLFSSTETITTTNRTKSERDDDLERCLAQMDHPLNQSVVAETKEYTSSKATKDNDGMESSDTNTKINAINNNNNNVTWKGTQNDIITKHQSSEFYLPSLQIELARHKHIGELSQFLLSKCPKLRMPTFERWLIDSKMEERLKRKQIEEMNMKVQMEQGAMANLSSHQMKKEKKWKQRLKRKRLQMKSSLERHMTTSGMRTLNDYDLVIPTMADVDDEATKRLVEEITLSSDGDNEKNEKISPLNICRELCQQACESTRHVQNLSHHLGGQIHVNEYISPGKKHASNTIGKIQLKIDNEGKAVDGGIGDKEESSFKRHKEESASSSCIYSLSYSRKSKKGGNDMKPFIVKINSQHYTKLRDMFNHIHSDERKLFVPLPVVTSKGSTNTSPATKVFNHLVFCMLVRYSSLSGGQQLLDLRGGGMQGAIHGQVFDSLITGKNECMFECFASPFNAYNSRYCSIFHQDLDYHFGSSGDFFSVPLGYFKKHGGELHEANPPFAPGLMSEMVGRLIQHLEFADYESSQNINDGKLTFVVVVPTCSNSDANLVQESANDSFKKMIKSPYFCKHIILKAREHGYVEGSQHLRQTRYKESQYSTSVIFLQSQKSREFEKSAPCFKTEELETKIRESFGSRHKDELEERRLHSNFNTSIEMKDNKKKSLKRVKKLKK